MKLRYKLFLAFFTLVILPLLVLGATTFSIIFNTIEKKHSQEAQYALQAISYSILNVFKEIDNVTDNGIATGLFQQALRAKDPQSQNLSDAVQLELNASQKHFRSQLYNHPSIDYAFLYNLSDKTTNNIISIFNKEDFQAMPYERFKEHELYEMIIASKGLPQWIAPYEYPELTGSNRVFTQIRLVKELSQLQKIGILLVQIKDWEMERIFQHLEIGQYNRNTRYLLVNEAGLIVYDYQSELDGQLLSKYMSLDVMKNDDEKSLKDNFAGEESIISMHPLQGYSWSLVSITPWSFLSQELVTVGKWFVLIMIICVIAALLFNVVFMKRITGTIGMIVRFMRKVESGDLTARVEEKGNDELLLLQQGFNSQMNKINDLFEEVKREQRNKANAELRVLQAQIKPHFLFNTLESINVLAVQNEGRKVSQMVLKLARILRISIQGSEVISLQLEVEHLQSYLEIQKFRFDTLFDYNIQLSEEMMKIPILKLTLQPLVENCIQHGFEGIEYGGEINVRGELMEHSLLIWVEDNGIGMTEEQLGLLEERQKDDGVYMVKGNHEYEEQRGFGLRSVVDRLKFQYGTEASLIICSEQGKGTIVQCRIPLTNWGRADDYEGNNSR